jgi:hypothetical protein
LDDDPFPPFLRLYLFNLTSSGKRCGNGLQHSRNSLATCVAAAETSRYV